MLALRCGPRLIGLLSGQRSAPLLLSATRACSDSGARDPNSSSRNPLVYLDVGADGQPLGRVVLEVRTLDPNGPAWAQGKLYFLGTVLWLARRVTLGLSFPNPGPQFPRLREATSVRFVPGRFHTLRSVEAEGGGVGGGE